MISRKIFFPITLLFLLGGACSAGVEEGTAISTSVITSTIPPTIAPASTETPLPPPAQSAAIPVEGTTSTQVNVRAEPSTAGSVLGILPANTRVEIVGRDPGGNWWQILYPQGSDSKGWVTAQYVLAANDAAIPVIGGNRANPNDGPVAIVQQQINVRSGPGTGFNSLGTLNPQDVVSLMGRDANGAWLQIAFAAGPEGKGWVNAGFVQAQGAENLPIITEAGQVIGTGTPTGIPPTPTATLIPAPPDNDSAESPIVNMTFSSVGTHTLIYNGDISAPAGDSDDWIRFVPYTRQVRVEISCTGSEPVIGITPDIGVASTVIQCDSQQVIPVEAEQPVVIHVQSPVGTAQTYSSYTIKVQSIP